jgi:VanZ family protein
VNARLLRLAFWAASAFAFIAAVMPHETAPDFGAGDKVNHMVAFLTLAVLGRLAYPHVRLRWLLAGLALFGLIIEVVQMIPALNRDADPRDWLADMAAALAGMALVSGWRRVHDTEEK